MAPAPTLPKESFGMEAHVTEVDEVVPAISVPITSLFEEGQGVRKRFKGMHSNSCYRARSF